MKELSDPGQVQDPILTDLGMQQSRALNLATEDTVQAQAELVVTSCVSTSVPCLLELS
jgi:hypothetical protein